MARVVPALSLVIALSLFVPPPAPSAQPAGKISRIGLLSNGSAAAPPPPLEAFRQGLRDLGWVEGQNIVIDYRFTEGKIAGLPELAAELVRLNPDVIVAGPTNPALAVKNATRTIPIVMLGAAEPVDLGLVASLARPGGNITGTSWSATLELIGKELELLKEAVPKLRLVAVLWNPANPAHTLAIRDLKVAARSLGVRLYLLEARGPKEFDGAFAVMAKQRAEAVLVVADTSFVEHRVRLAELATRYRLPSMHGLRQNVDAGGLMSYGPNTAAVWRRTASFVDRILKGAKPAELPVEQPTKYDLVINLQTARALGLTVPPSLLLRAEHVIQ